MQEIPGVLHVLLHSLLNSDGVVVAAGSSRAYASGKAHAFERPHRGIRRSIRRGISRGIRRGIGSNAHAAIRLCRQYSHEFSSADHFDGTRFELDANRSLHACVIG